MVLMPRVCWNCVETAALGAAVREAALIAETKVRFWIGAAANCLAALRRARGACLEAIMNVRRVCEGILMREVWGIVDSLWETSGYVESTFCPSSSRHRGLELVAGDANRSPRPIKSSPIPYKWGTPSQSQIPKFMRRSLSNVRARGVRLETLFTVSSRLSIAFLTSQHRAKRQISTRDRQIARKFPQLRHKARAFTYHRGRNVWHERKSSESVKYLQQTPRAREVIVLCELSSLMNNMVGLQ